MRRAAFVARAISAEADGRRLRIDVRAYRPVRSRAGEYRCRCEIAVGRKIRSFSIAGEDAVQSLLLALRFIGMELELVTRDLGCRIPQHALADLVKLRMPVDRTRMDQRGSRRGIFSSTSSSSKKRGR